MKYESVGKLAKRWERKNEKRGLQKFVRGEHTVLPSVPTTTTRGALAWPAELARPTIDYDTLPDEGHDALATANERLEIEHRFYETPAGETWLRHATAAYLRREDKRDAETREAATTRYLERHAAPAAAPPPRFYFP